MAGRPSLGGLLPADLIVSGGRAASHDVPWPTLVLDLGSEALVRLEIARWRSPDAFRLTASRLTRSWPPNSGVGKAFFDEASGEGLAWRDF